jgi:hypothetical protein
MQNPQVVSIFQGISSRFEQINEADHPFNDRDILSEVHFPPISPAFHALDYLHLCLQIGHYLNFRWYAQADAKADACPDMRARTVSSASVSAP